MNIWNIKSKALRAIVAWLAAGVAALVVLALLVPALIVIGAYGVWEGIRALRHDVDAASIRNLWWRAATGKEAV